MALTRVLMAGPGRARALPADLAEPAARAEARAEARVLPVEARARVSAEALAAPLALERLAGPPATVA